MVSRLALDLAYDSQVVPPAQAMAISDLLTRVLAAMAAEPAGRHENLAITSTAERHQILREWNDTGLPEAPAMPLHLLFQQHARRAPEELALVDDQRELRYAELDLESDRMARHLRERGVGPEVLVGICLERSIDFVVALLGTLKAGGAFVPLARGSPAERLAFLLHDADVRVLVT